MRSTYLSSRPALSCALVCGAFFLLAVIGTEFSKLDVRFAFILQSMADHPVGMFPRINGVPYADYFSPFFFLTYLTTLGGRSVGLWNLALPSILFAAITLGMTFRTGERIVRGAGLWAVLLLVSGFEYVYTICQFGIDLSIAAAASVMLYALVSAEDRLKTCVLFALLTAAALFFRGSLGLVVFAGAVAGWVLATRKWKNILRYGLAGTAAAVLGSGLILLLIYREGGRELLETFREWQIGKRIEGGDYFYYFLDGFFSFAPGSLLVLAALICDRKNLKSGPTVPLLGFLLLPIVVLSVPGGKHLRYIVPLLPAGALAGAVSITRLLPQLERHAPTAMRFLQWFPLAGIAAVPGMLTVGLLRHPAGELPWFHFGAAAAIFAAVFVRRKRFAGAAGAFAMFTLCLLTAYCALAIPMIGLEESSRPFVREIEAERRGALAFYGMDPDHDALKYLVWMPREDRNAVHFLLPNYRNTGSHYDRMYPQQTDAAEAIRALRPGDVVIVRDKRFARLKADMAAANRYVGQKRKGRLGHRHYYAVTVTLTPPETARGLPENGNFSEKTCKTALSRVN